MLPKESGLDKKMMVSTENMLQYSEPKANTSVLRCSYPVRRVVRVRMCSAMPRVTQRFDPSYA